MNYTYRKPTRGTKDSATIPINWFGMHKQVALLHTDPKYASDIFSQIDEDLANRRGMLIYVATPKGTLWKYNPSDGSDIIVFDDIPFNSNRPGR